MTYPQPPPPPPFQYPSLRYTQSDLDGPLTTCVTRFDKCDVKLCVDAGGVLGGFLPSTLSRKSVVLDSPALSEIDLSVREELTSV
jgi:hypothetical protein